VALRVKCKCGKSMQVPTALAGKQVRCPSCKRTFSIPLEEFKRFAARKAATPPADVNPPTLHEPPAEATTPDPIELEVLPVVADPSSANFATLESSGPSGRIPTAQPVAASSSGKLGLTCPLCRKALPPGAVVCMDCGFNVATGTYLKGTAAPTATAVNAAPTTTYASDRPWLAGSKPGLLDRDVVHGPQRTFWADAVRAFAYPFLNTNNGVVFGTILFADYCGVFLVLAFAILPCFLLVPAVILGVFFIRGWIAAVMLAIIQDTASGSEDLPGLKMQDGVLEDVIKPLLKYIGATACALLPASFAVILMTCGILPDSLLSGVNVAILLAAGIFVWPVFLMLFAFDEPAKILRLDLIATTIFRTIVPYLCLWLLLMLASFRVVLEVAARLLPAAGINVTIPQLPVIPGLIGGLFFSAVDLYLSIVSMRLIGLYYLHFKRRFTLIME